MRLPSGKNVGLPVFNGKKHFRMDLYKKKEMGTMQLFRELAAPYQSAKKELASAW